MTIWIVSYIENNRPVVTPFDNASAALACYECFRQMKYQSVELDECQVFSRFVVTNGGED